MEGQKPRHARPGDDDDHDAEPRAADAARTPDARALLSAADDAITRALSRNSAEFLRQTRQLGGQ
jgi:hypothetical protein